ncbi:unnamed protein product [Prorocentrum cordatum]|uniref:SH3 domain-containing protein n=1 Tax=Prorocentrum cordatum TaxID=2364126 RepID=A0ABN9S7M8_9DINO|nr:unnamed protein product [Polarella glacialis]
MALEPEGLARGKEALSRSGRLAERAVDAARGGEPASVTDALGGYTLGVWPLGGMTFAYSMGLPEGHERGHARQCSTCAPDSARLTAAVSPPACRISVVRPSLTIPWLLLMLLILLTSAVGANLPAWWDRPLGHLSGTVGWRPPQEPDAVIASAEAAVSGGDLSAALAALVQLKARQWTREHADAAGTAGASAATAAAASAVGRRPQQTQQAAALAQASAVAAAAAASPVLTRKQQQQQMLQQQRHQAMMQQQQLRQQQLHHQQLQQQLHAQQLQQHQAMLLQRAQAAQAAQAAAQQKQAAAQQAAAQQAAAQQAAAQQAAQQRRVADIGPPATIPAEEAETGKVMKVLTRFDGSSDASQLQLQPGDSVAVLEQHASGWVFGRKVEKGGADDPEGWFPLWALQSR